MKRKAGGRIRGLSSESKPTAAAEPIDTIFEETNTGKNYRNSGADWFPHYVKGPYEFIIQKDGSNYYCQDSNGYVVSGPTTDPAVPMQYALDQDSTWGQKIFITKGVYDFPASPANNRYLLLQKMDKRIECDPGAALRVPNGFTGDFLEITGDGGRRYMWDGGFIQELGTPQKLWDCFYLHGTDTSGGVYGRIRNTMVRNPARWIHIFTEGTNPAAFWCNGNIFETNTVFNPRKAFVEFGTSTSSTISYTSNQFRDNVLQCSADTEWGIKNIGGRRNTFINNNVWDFLNPTAAGYTSNIISTAENTHIFGGIMSHIFDDQGIDTFCMDAYSVKIPANYLNYFPTNRLQKSGLTLGGIEHDRLMPSPSVKKTGGYMGTGATTGYGMCEGKVASIAAAVGVVPTFDTDGTANLYTATASAGARVGSRSTEALTRRDWGCYFECKVKATSIADVRIGAGFMGLSGTDPAAAADPLNVLHGAIIWLDNNGTTWKVRSNNGTGAATQTDTGITATTNATTLRVYLVNGIPNYPSNSAWFYKIDNSVWTRLITDLPGTTTNLSPMVWLENVAGAATKDFRLYYWHVESDK